MSGMLPPWLYDLLNVSRRTPSQLTEDSYKGVDKLAIKMPPEEFLSAPVTEMDRELLRLAPRGMLYNLNRNALDRELDLILRARKGRTIAM